MWANIQQNVVLVHNLAKCRVTREGHVMVVWSGKLCYSMNPAPPMCIGLEPQLLYLVPRVVKLANSTSRTPKLSSV